MDPDDPVDWGEIDPVASTPPDWEYWQDAPSDSDYLTYSYSVEVRREEIAQEEEEQEPLPSVVFPLAQVLKRIQQTMGQLEVPSATPRGLPLLQMDRLELLVRQVELLHQAAVRLYQERRAEQVQFLLRQVVLPEVYSPTDPEEE